MADPVIVPRNFRLLAELDKGQDDPMMSYGLTVDAEPDILMHDWQANIIAPQRGPFGGNFYALSIYCGDNYPDERPVVRFVTKINLPCVKPNGEVNPARLPCLARWQRDFSIKTVLEDIMRMMSSEAASKLPQPPPNETF